MGRGVIKENLGEGLYRVEIDLDTTRIVRRREELQRQLDQLDIDITAQETTVADLEDAWRADQEDAEKLAALMSARSELAHMHARRAAARSALETLQGADVQDYQLDLWCADYTLDLSAGKYVGIAEIPGELRWGNIRPAYDGRADYTQARDGAMNPALNLPPASAVLYWALRPSWQRYHPTYRYGTLAAVDTDADIATVDLAPMKSSDQSVDVNLETTLTDIPVFYMDCNAAVFETGDEVLVEFPNLDWSSARVAGFRRNPKPCRVCDYLRLTVNGHIAHSVRASGYARARIMDAETGLFMLPTGQAYPERYFNGELLYVGDMELDGNQYVDLSAHTYEWDAVSETYTLWEFAKNWCHNRRVWPQYVVVNDGISELLSDDIFGLADVTNPNADLPELTPEDAGRIVRVFASPFSNRFRINLHWVSPGNMRMFLWDGISWHAHGGSELNYLQYRYVIDRPDYKLGNVCDSGVDSPEVQLANYVNSWLRLSVGSDPISAQVNWILHQTLISDAVITEEEVNGELALVASLDFTAKRINEHVDRALVCNIDDTALISDTDTTVNAEDQFLGYTSIAGGLSGWPVPRATDGRLLWYDFFVYCESEDRDCFGYFIDEYTTTTFENLVVVTDELGRNPSFAESYSRTGVIYGIRNPDLSVTYDEKAPKQLRTYTMVDA